MSRTDGLAGWHELHYLCLDRTPCILSFFTPCTARSLPVALMELHSGADLRGKELAMRLMMHPDAEVQKQALLAVQKILLAKDKVAYLNN